MKNYSQKKQFFLATFFIFCFLFFSTNSASAQKKAKEQKPLLWGKIFIIEFMEFDKNKDTLYTPDELFFRLGKLNSGYMLRERNFIESPYTATVDSTSGTKTIVFECESKNIYGDVLKWSGKVADGIIDGTAVITNKKGKGKMEYPFHGELKGRK